MAKLKRLCWYRGLRDLLVGAITPNHGFCVLRVLWARYDRMTRCVVELVVRGYGGDTLKNGGYNGTKYRLPRAAFTNGRGQSVKGIYLNGNATHIYAVDWWVREKRAGHPLPSAPPRSDISPGKEAVVSAEFVHVCSFCGQERSRERDIRIANIRDHANYAHCPVCFQISAEIVPPADISPSVCSVFPKVEAVARVTAKSPSAPVAKKREKTPKVAAVSLPKISIQPLSPADDPFA